LELASRGKRFVAAVLDTALLVLPWTLSDVEALPLPVRDVFAFAFAALLVAQAALLARRGQTVGKAWLGIRIVRKATGENGGFATNVLLRGLLNGLLALNPLYFLVDSLLLLRAERRCLHDYIADTLVVEA